jgi:hypothetical protein
MIITSSPLLTLRLLQEGLRATTLRSLRVTLSVPAGALANVPEHVTGRVMGGILSTFTVSADPDIFPAIDGTVIIDGLRPEWVTHVEVV